MASPHPSTALLLYCSLDFFSAASAMTASATCCIDSRRSIEVFWIQRNAAGSVSPYSVCRTLLARSTSLRVSSRRERSATSCSSVFSLFPRLKERANQKGGTLSGGEQQMLAMGRALMCRPKLLMLDEPSMGLSPIMMQKIMQTIAELKAQGTTILLVEQNAQAALSLADHGHVMEIGKIVLSGTGEALLHDESVRKAYLGED